MNNDKKNNYKLYYTEDLLEDLKLGGKLEDIEIDYDIKLLSNIDDIENLSDNDTLTLLLFNNNNLIGYSSFSFNYSNFPGCCGISVLNEYYFLKKNYTKTDQLIFNEFVKLHKIQNLNNKFKKFGEKKLIITTTNNFKDCKLMNSLIINSKLFTKSKTFKNYNSNNEVNIFISK